MVSVFYFQVTYFKEQQEIYFYGEMVSELKLFHFFRIVSTVSNRSSAYTAWHLHVLWSLTWQLSNNPAHLCGPQTAHSHVLSPQSVLSHGPDAYFYHSSQGDIQLSLWSKNQCLFVVCNAIPFLSDRGRVWGLSPVLPRWPVINFVTLFFIAML